MWSLIGDFAWKNGFHGVADLAYAQAFRQAARRHENQALIPMRTNFMYCQHPDCVWHLIGAGNELEAIMEYSRHDCPVTVEDLEGDVDW